MKLGVKTETKERDTLEKQLKEDVNAYDVTSKSS